MVVNGTEPEDWPAVQALAEAFPATVMPSFGVHPWKVNHVAEDWEMQLICALEDAPGRVGIGEVGLDRWVEDPDFEKQRRVFRTQLRLAAEKNLPLTIHCLRAWGPLLEDLRANPRPARGFLVHSPGASPETIAQLVDLGAYFSVSGYFAFSEKKKYQRALSAVPRERLLIETDAPDMLPPEGCIETPLHDPATGERVNHPGNLFAIYRFVADHLQWDPEGLRDQVAVNFEQLFGER